MQESVLRATLGDQNVWEIDASVPIVSGSTKIWFTLKRSVLDEDADAVAKYGLNVVGLDGITVTSEANGVFQVVSDPTDLPVTLQDKALVFDCQIQLSGGQPRTIAKGHVTLHQSVTRTTV